jgi:hypothetical protein
VVVPRTDETVATGAAAQAAHVVGGGTLDEIASRWSLGAGDVVEPGRDATARRSTYARVRDRYLRD